MKKRWFLLGTGLILMGLNGCDKKEETAAGVSSTGTIQLSQKTLNKSDGTLEPITVVVDSSQYSEYMQSVTPSTALSVEEVRNTIIAQHSSPVAVSSLGGGTLPPTGGGSTPPGTGTLPTGGAGVHTGP